MWTLCDCVYFQVLRLVRPRVYKVQASMCVCVWVFPGTPVGKTPGVQGTSLNVCVCVWLFPGTPVGKTPGVQATSLVVCVCVGISRYSPWKDPGCTSYKPRWHSTESTERRRCCHTASSRWTTRQRAECFTASRWTTYTVPDIPGSCTTDINTFIHSLHTCTTMLVSSESGGLISWLDYKGALDNIRRSRHSR